MPTKRPLKYLASAPPALCDYHRQCLADRGAIRRPPVMATAYVADADRAITILGVLVTDERMQPVWIALKRRSKHDLWFWFFWRQCIGGIALYSSTPKRTTKEKSAELASIAKQARALADTLSGSHFLASVEVRELLREPDLVRLARALHIYGISEDVNIHPAHVPNALILPPVQVLMVRLADEADRLASNQSPMPQPRAPDAAQHFFIRHISDYFRQTYGLPLHGHVAAITAVVLNVDDVDTGTVRALVTAATRRKIDGPKEKSYSL